MRVSAWNRARRRGARALERLVTQIASRDAWRRPSRPDEACGNSSPSSRVTACCLRSGAAVHIDAGGYAGQQVFICNCHVAQGGPKKDVRAEQAHRRDWWLRLRRRPSSRPRARDHLVTVIDDLSVEQLTNLGPAAGNVDLCVADVSRRGHRHPMPRARRPDAVVHLAALHFIAASRPFPGATIGRRLIRTTACSRVRTIINRRGRSWLLQRRGTRPDDAPAQ